MVEKDRLMWHLEVLNSLNINIPVCGMVKDDKHKTRGLIYNNIELNYEKQFSKYALNY